MKTYPYWWDTVAAQPSPSANRQATLTKPDVVIVGAGYTGLAAARHLARVGASVVVLERERAGWGASSRNGGQVLTGLKVDAATLVDRYGEARARELYGEEQRAIARLESLIAEESIACDYGRVGHVQAAWKPAHFAAFCSEQALLARVFAHRVELVGRAGQKAEVGSDRYHGLLVDESSAALNPARYAHGLAEAARRAGAAIVEGAAVDRIAPAGTRWSVSAGASSIDAGDVLLATNGYTDEAAPALQRRLIPIGSYIIATEPLAADVAASLLPRRRVAFDSKNFLYYFRVTDDRRLLFGGRAEFSTPTAASTARAAAILHDGMIDVFPQLAGALVEYAWSGNVAFTRDELPHAGRLDGLYYAGGYCGHGIAMATYLGEQIARRMAGEPIGDPLFDDHFPPIPLYSGTPWFLPLVGAYYQVKDWLQ
ncbi:MAG TPA: FAD-binding oxidoreductase [Vicinamibacterales bacterium]|nr:FAD-binding oxidoreductase [Vicinamibacterales bacterium]